MPGGGLLLRLPSSHHAWQSYGGPELAPVGERDPSDPALDGDDDATGEVQFRADEFRIPDESLLRDDQRGPKPLIFVASGFHVINGEKPTWSKRCHHPGQLEDLSTGGVGEDQVELTETAHDFGSVTGLEAHPWGPFRRARRLLDVMDELDGLDPDVQALPEPMDQPREPAPDAGADLEDPTTWHGLREHRQQPSHLEFAGKPESGGSRSLVGGTDALGKVSRPFHGAIVPELVSAGRWQSTPPDS